MFKKLLVPVELSYPNTAAKVYKRAANHAKLSGAEIRLVTVMPGFSMPLVASVVPDSVIQNAKDHVKALMKAFVDENCDDQVTYAIRTGKNWEEIIKEADRWGADLIIVYHNHRRDINEVFSRSCSQRVSDHASCSVLRLRNIQS